MIKPSNKLLKWIDSFESQARLARALDIDEATLSRILSEKIPATHNIIEAFYKLNGWPINEAWEITDE